MERATSWQRRQMRAKHAARSACFVGGRLVLHVTKCARASRHGTRKRRLRRWEAAAADRSRCRRKGASANGVGWSAPRVGCADKFVPSTQRAVRALRLVGWLSTGLSARAPHATGLNRDGYEGSKPQPPTGRGVGAKEPRSTARGGARRELDAQTTAPSAQRAERVLCGRAAGSPPDLVRARRASRD